MFSKVVKDLFIGGDKTIREICEEFSSVFPYLKIEFFSKPRKKNEDAFASQMLPHHLKLGAFRVNCPGGVIVFHELKTVTELEDEFEKKFGLFVRVFRRSGNLWIETNMTYDWTLIKQNKEGMELSAPI